jgi:hypothetical protein
MNQQPHEQSIRENLQGQRYRAATQSQRDDVNGTFLLAKLVYAVLIVGCVGYYLDKALEIVRQ